MPRPSADSAGPLGVHLEGLQHKIQTCSSKHKFSSPVRSSPLVWEPHESLELQCGLLGLGCNSDYFVSHQTKPGISWLWRCPFIVYLPPSRLNTANSENVSAGPPAAYLPTLTSSSYLLWVICSGFVFPLILQVCLAQQKTCYFVLSGIWQENKKNTEKKRIIIVFFLMI